MASTRNCMLSIATTLFCRAYNDFGSESSYTTLSFKNASFTPPKVFSGFSLFMFLSAAPTCDPPGPPVICDEAAADDDAIRELTAETFSGVVSTFR
eukprot:TRINITY_DN14121_c0_g1_i1.p2 TRINITY_DN14121_c0_g1~~TRINITY_DN14121_c0_g1_i1.p2  ORF type:complete len:96 (+),score=8.98 TRINITY_DN14121_c0_g1_i1:209-496(+)